MKVILNLERDQLETIKTSLDLSATYWKNVADKEGEEKHRNRFLELHSHYSNLRDEIKSIIK